MWEAIVCRVLVTDRAAMPPVWKLVASLARDEFAGFCTALRPFIGTKLDIATDAIRSHVRVNGGWL